MKPGQTTSRWLINLERAAPYLLNCAWGWNFGFSGKSQFSVTCPRRCPTLIFRISNNTVSSKPVYPPKIDLILPANDQFFLLDEPFTDMDTTRHTAAIQAIGTFSEHHQVLFFTCHPEHAGELQNHANAKTLKVTE